MADVSVQTLRVLRSILELEAFTMPQLTAASGASYETVKRVLRAQDGSTVKRTGDKLAQAAVGRPAYVWTIVNREPIEERLKGWSEELETTGTDTQTPATDTQTPATGSEPEPPSVDPRLDEAEDYLVFAFQAADDDDVEAFARQALAALRDAGFAPPDDAAGADVGDALVEPQNLPVREARARIVGAVAEYLKSGEARGWRGPLWRQAFKTAASLDVPEQVGLQKRFLVELVRVADERSDLHLGTPEPERSDLVEPVATLVSEAQGLEETDELVAAMEADDELSPEAARAALAQFVAQAGRGERAIDDTTAKTLFPLVRAAFPPGIEASGEVLEPLVDGLSTLAAHGDQPIAEGAQETLIAIRQPSEGSFWRRLAQEAPGVSHGIVFEGLSQTSLEAAFSYLREALDDTASIVDVREALVHGLSALDKGMGATAQHHFAEFLASVPAEDRSYLVAAPALAGLDWPAPAFERPLVSRFLAILTRWQAFAHGEQADERFAEQTDGLGREVRRLAIEVFPLLGEDDQRSVSRILATEARWETGAAVCVPPLLALGLEHELAACVVEAASDDEELWAWVTHWYLETCPRDDLDVGQRSALLNALQAALGRQGRSFLIGLARASRSREELPELTEIPSIDVLVMAELEMEMTGSYSNVGESLREDGAVLMAAAG